MPSSEKVISPGVFTNEVDQSFLPAAVGEIGAALIGPTPKGPPLRPTVVSSYSEFDKIFGSTFKSGSQSHSYLTSLAARSYLQHGNKLTVVRILDGNFKQAFTNVATGSGTFYTGSSPFVMGGPIGTATSVSASMGNENAIVNVQGVEFINNVQNVATSASKASFTLKTISYGHAMHNWSAGAASASSAVGTNGVLHSGSADNIRWEVTGTSHKKGTFNLLVRAGNDSHKRKQILETWNNLTLDPNSDNYIERVIWNSNASIEGTTSEPYIFQSGSYPNKSKYVYVQNVNQTIDYIDENGSVRVGAASSSLPGIGSGSAHGTFISGSDGWTGFDAVGNRLNASGSVSASAAGGMKLYENICTDAGAGESQGYLLANDDAAEGSIAYQQAINLLANEDEYDINLLLMPGVI